MNLSKQLLQIHQNPLQLKMTRLTKNKDDEHRFQLSTESDEFIVNTDYDFSADPYSVQNVTEIIDYVEREK